MDQRRIKRSFRNNENLGAAKHNSNISSKKLRGRRRSRNNNNNNNNNNEKRHTKKRIVERQNNNRQNNNRMNTEINKIENMMSKVKIRIKNNKISPPQTFNKRSKPPSSKYTIITEEN